jgi:hypothetical protein
MSLVKYKFHTASNMVFEATPHPTLQNCLVLYITHLGKKLKERRKNMHRAYIYYNLKPPFW